MPSGSHIEPLSSVDAAWLGMEHPTNLMMVTGIITFREALDVPALREVFRCRWHKYRRFRQRVSRPKLPIAPESWTPAFWESTSDFHLDHHIHEIHLEAPGDRAMLQSVVSDLMSCPLDFTRPPWDFHVIQNYEGGSALFVRIHHCIADGMALIQVLLSATDDSPDAPLPVPDEEIRPPPPSGSLLEEAMDAVLNQVSAMATGALKLYGTVIEETLGALGDPSKALDLARTGSEGALTLQRVLTRPDDPPTPFKGDLGRAKSAAWSRPLDLDEIKGVKNALGGTVNDVLVSAAAGGLRRYLIGRGAAVEGVEIRAAIPVNLRRNPDMSRLGNKFGLVFLALPIGIEDPVDRLIELRARMDALKKSQEAPLFYGLLKTLGFTPSELQGSVVKALSAKITAVMSNVPGPRQRLFLAGRQIDEMMFWVPQAGRVGLGLSILSYNNKVWTGVATDRELVPDPDGIIDGFLEEYQALVDAARSASPPAPNAEITSAQPESESETEPEPEPDPEPGIEAAAEEGCIAVTDAGIACTNGRYGDSTYCEVHAIRFRD